MVQTCVTFMGPNTPSEDMGEKYTYKQCSHAKKPSHVVKALVASLCLPGLCMEIDPLYPKDRAPPSLSIHPPLPWAPPS